MSSPSQSHEPRERRSSAGRRSTSLGGLLKRSKSNEPLGTQDRKTSGSKKKSQKELAREEELRRQQEANAVPKQAPKLPDLASYPQLKTFGGEDHRPDSVAIISNQVGGRNHPKASMDNPNRIASVPMPPMPGNPNSGNEQNDPYARTESMTHRGRYSYASSAVSTLNSPRRVRRRKDPTPYNILIIGSQNSGKTSFLKFLKTSLALPPKKRPTRGPEEFESPPASARANRNFVHHYLETEIEGERVGLTLWDSQGLQKNLVDLQLREMSGFLESKFEDTFTEEQKVIRSPGSRDTHIHCVFFILDPVRLDANIAAAQQENANGISNGKFNLSTRIVGGLDDDFDLQVLRTLQGKTTVVPVISKADTITSAHMSFLKRIVWDSLKKAGLDPLEALNFEEESEDDDEIAKSKFHFDERDEDEAAQRDADEENGAAGSPHTSDSETVPAEQPTPIKNRSAHARKPSNPIALAKSEGELPFLPLSILSPDSYSLSNKDGPVGRQFPWGFADPHNPEHCDFVKLKENVFSEWRFELREASREVFYERWRTSRLDRQRLGQVANGGAKRNTPLRGKIR